MQPGRLLQGTLVLATVLSQFLCTTAHVLAEDSDDIVKVGDPAPDFKASSTDGKSISLAELKGKVVLLNFFATWCGPCCRELPHLEAEIWQKLKDKGLAVLVVGREHSIEELSSFMKKTKLTMPVLADPDRKIFALYAKGTIPRNYVIDREGKVILAETGYTKPEFKKMLSLIEATLSGKSETNTK